MTLEDETGIANIVVWPKVMEQYRKEVMGARLILVEGYIQSSPEQVTHLVAQRMFDRSGDLIGLADNGFIRKHAVPAGPALIEPLNDGSLNDGFLNDDRRDHPDARRKASAASAQEFYAVGPAAAPDHLAGLALRTFRHHRHHEVVPDIDGSVGHDLGAARRDVQDNAFNSRYAVIARKPGRPLVHFASRFTLGLCPQFINSHDDHPSLDQTGHSVSGQMDTGSHRKNASHSETGARF